MPELTSSPKAHTITWPFSPKTAEDIDYNFDVLLRALSRLVAALNGISVGEAADPLPVVVQTSNLLEALVHLDTRTKTRVRGDLVVALGEGEGGSDFWFDGLPVADVPGAENTTGQNYWFDGAPAGGVDEGASGPTVKWDRLAIGPAGTILGSNGAEPVWSVSGAVGEIIASAQPKARVYSTGTQLIVNGAGTDSPFYGGTRVAFAGESYDSDTFHDPVTNNARLTVPPGKSGVYLIVAQASWQTSAAGRKACWIIKNNTSRLGISEVCGDDGGLNLSHTATSFAVLAAGDYVEMHVRQDSGGALFALGGVEADGLCSLAMYKLP